MRKAQQRTKTFFYAAAALCFASYIIGSPTWMLILMSWFCSCGLYKDLKFEVLNPTVKLAWCLLLIASVNFLLLLLQKATQGSHFDARYTGYLIAGLVWIYASPRYIFRITKKLDLCQAYLIEKSTLAKTYSTNSLYHRFVFTLIMLALVELVRIF